MNSRLSAVMQRRGELLARIASQREQLAEIGEHLQAPLALADRGVAIVRSLISNPVLVAGVIVVLAIRRRSVIGVAKVALRVWKGYRSFTAITSRFSQ